MTAPVIYPNEQGNSSFHPISYLQIYLSTIFLTIFIILGSHFFLHKIHHVTGIAIQYICNFQDHRQIDFFVFLSLVNVADYNPAFLRNSALLISLCTEDPEFLKIDLHLNTPYNSPCKFRECRKTLLLSFLFYYRSAMSLFQDITHSFANSFNRFIDNY